jgi:hypothetical protein
VCGERMSQSVRGLWLRNLLEPPSARRGLGDRVQVFLPLERTTSGRLRLPTAAAHSSEA